MILRFAFSWVFRALLMALGLLVLLKKSGVATTSGFVEVITQQYIELSRVLFGWVNALPIPNAPQPAITPDESILLTSILIVLVPIFTAIAAPGLKRGALVLGSLIIVATILLVVYQHAAQISQVAQISIILLATVPMLFSFLALIMPPGAADYGRVYRGRLTLVVRYLKDFLGAGFIIYMIYLRGLLEPAG